MINLGIDMAQRITITGREWARKVIEGERDFSRKIFVGEPITLEELEQMNRHLKEAFEEGRLQREPLILDLADISGTELPVIYSPGPNIKPVSIYAPHTKARGIKAVRASVKWAFLPDSDFGPYENPNHSHTRSNLRDLEADNATLIRSSIRGARVAGMRFLGTNLSYADMTDLVGLGRARYVGYGTFTGALVSPKDDGIIRGQTTYRVAGSARQ